MKAMPIMMVKLLGNGLNERIIYSQELRKDLCAFPRKEKHGKSTEEVYGINSDSYWTNNIISI
jgi:hypothetical protein